MALTECTECGQQVSTKAGACPHCGAPVGVEETATASESNAPSVPQVSVIPAAPALEAMPASPTEPKKRPSLGKVALVLLGGLVLTVALANALTPGSSESEETPAPAASSESAESGEAKPSAPKPKPLAIAVTAEEETEAEVLEITGKTLPGAMVTANGQPVELAADGSFVYAATLAPGANPIEFAATLEGYTTANKRVTVNRLAFVPLSPRDFGLVAKDPDSHVGEAHIIYGEVIQFDAATGKDTFRANTGAVKSDIEYGWMTDYELNTMLTGDATLLANVVQGDCFEAKAVCKGSFTYETQIGGETTVPLYQVYAISVYGTVTQ